MSISISNALFDTDFVNELYIREFDIVFVEVFVFGYVVLFDNVRANI
jgi:hypothetical protein